MGLTVRHPYTVDIAGGTQKEKIADALIYGDANAHEVAVTVRDSGADAVLTGYSGILYAVRMADRVTIPNEAAIVGNVVTAKLAQSCLLARGRVDLLLTLTKDGDSFSPLWVEANCAGGITDTIADPSEIIPSLSDLLAQIAVMEAATDDANAATTAANEAAEAANTATDNAQDAADAITDITAEAGTLEPGAPATAFAETDPEDGHINLVFGIPQGVQGVRGTLTYSGTAITGTSTTPTAYATGIAAALPGDRYRYNGTVTAHVGNEYVCTVGGDAATALWAYDGNVRGAAGTGNVSFVDGLSPDVDGDVLLGAVRYGAAQSLTDPQKAQARSNAGALGGADVVNALDSTETAKPLSAAQGKALKEQVDAKAATATISASLPASGWSASAPYTQTVTATGILATDTPLADVVLSDTPATAITQLEAYGYIGRMDAGSGQITATCYEDKPTVDLTVALKVVR